MCCYLNVLQLESLQFFDMDYSLSSDFDHYFSYFLDFSKMGYLQGYNLDIPFQRLQPADPQVYSMDYQGCVIAMVCSFTIDLVVEDHFYQLQLPRYMPRIYYTQVDSHYSHC